MTPDTLQRFLSSTPWADARLTPIAGDASARAYFRLSGGPRSALLMVAPARSCGPLEPFIGMTGYLHRIGLRAPEILAADPGQGLLLLEDFGDNLMARVAARDPDRQAELYARATDVLVTLHHASPPDVIRVGPRDLAAMIEPVFMHYAPEFRDGAAVVADLGDLLSTLPPWRATPALRDYHAENLMVLGGSADSGTLGLLDYQDAILTHPAYDLASLLQDARRLVPEALQTEMIARFLRGTGLDPEPFRAGYHLVALQRNLRILGIFARLVSERPGSRYAAFQPIVWHHVQRMLAEPACAALRDRLAALPAPETMP